MTSGKRRNWSRHWRLSAVSAVASVGLLLAACGTGGSSSSAASSTSSKGPIYFGAVLALTGPYAAIETPNLQGLQAAVAVINKSGGILGRKVVFNYVDDQSDPNKAAAAIQQLVGSHSYSFIEAEVIPALQQAMLPYTNQLKIVSIEPTLGPGLFDPSTNPYNFTIVPGTAEVKGLLAGIKKLAGTKAPEVGVINDTVSADVSLAQSVVGGIGGIGGKVVSQDSAAPSTTDLSIQVAKAKAAGANVLYIQGQSGLCTAAGNAVQQLGWTSVKVLVDPGCVSKTVMASVAPSVQPRFFALGQSIYLRTGSQSAQEAAFLKALTAIGPVQDLAISTDSYDCVMLAAWAVKHAGTTDPTKMLAALQSLHSTPVPAGTLVGIASPRYSSTDHGYDSADVSNYYALLNAGNPVDGRYTGESITLGSS